MSDNLSNIIHRVFLILGIYLKGNVLFIKTTDIKSHTHLFLVVDYPEFV